MHREDGMNQILTGLIIGGLIAGIVIASAHSWWWLLLLVAIGLGVALRFLPVRRR